MKGFGENQSNNKKTANKNFYNNDLIQKAFKLQSEGKKLEAAKYYSYLIKKGLKDYRIFTNFGAFLKEIGKYKEAELELKKAIQLNPRYANAYYNLGVLFIRQGNLFSAEIQLRKATELKPDFSIAHYNLGYILKDLGKLSEAEFHTKKAIEIDPYCTDAYFSLTTINKNYKDEKWQNQLFSEQLLKNKDKRELVNIFFARSNVLHEKREYIASAKNLIAANDIKLTMQDSITKLLIKKTNKLKTYSENYKTNIKKLNKEPVSIFIVGLPRCGSTLIESIISLNPDIKDLGEVNFFEESFKQFIKSDKKLSLAEIYRKKQT